MQNRVAIQNVFSKPPVFDVPAAEIMHRLTEIVFLIARDICTNSWYFKAAELKNESGLSKLGLVHEMMATYTYTSGALVH